MACVLLACTQPPTNVASSLVFPTQHPLPDPQAYPAALIAGTLTLDASCVRLATADASYLVVWPTGFRYQVQADQIVILDASGAQRAAIGQEVLLGGGEIPSEPAAWQASAGLQQNPPEACPGPYWYAAPDLRVHPA